jgi:hypothetical protein
MVLEEGAKREGVTLLRKGVRNGGFRVIRPQGMCKGTVQLLWVNCYCQGLYKAVKNGSNGQSWYNRLFSSGDHGGGRYSVE